MSLENHCGNEALRAREYKAGARHHIWASNFSQLAINIQFSCIGCTNIENGERHLVVLVETDFVEPHEVWLLKGVVIPNIAGSDYYAH